MPDTFPDVEKELLEIFFREELPDGEEYLSLLKTVRATLDSEAAEYRPRSQRDYPGGLIYLNPGLDTVVVPDLHARTDFFASMLLGRSLDDIPVAERLIQGDIQVVCVGDGFHAEARAYKRWLAAFDEFSKGYRRHKHMDQEMRESLGLMEMVMRMKNRFPRNFHFLKGNHENITNEQGDGNYPFGKFAYEGAMVTHWVKLFYGEDFLLQYYDFEKTLPLLSVGRNFLVSHAEPAVFLPEDRIINYRDDPEVVYSLTWTDNDASEDGSVRRMLEHYLQDAEGAYYFGGHRPIQDRFFLRAEGRYVQIHNPGRFVMAYLKAQGDIDLDRDVRFIDPTPQLKKPSKQRQAPKAAQKAEKTESSG